MDYRDYYSGLHRNHYRDPFPHSLLSTREFSHIKSKHHPELGFEVSIFSALAFRRSLAIGFQAAP